MPRHITTLPTVAHPVPIEADARPFQDMPIDSMEVAESVGKAHSHVLRDIRRIITDLEKAEPGSGQSKFGLTSYPDDQGKMRPCYRMSKNGLLVLASGYSAPLRAKLVDRLEYLERAVAQPVIPTSYWDALRLAADRGEEAERQRIEAEKARAVAIETQALLTAQEPLVALAKRMLASPETMTITEAEKLVKLSTHKAFPILAEGNIIFRRPSRSGKSRWQGTANALRRGYVEHEAYPVPTAGGPVEVYQVKLTGKGVAKLISLLVNVQLDFGLDDDGEVADA